MSKSTNFYAGQPILGQLLNYIPKEIFAQSVSAYSSDDAHRTVSSWDQFTFMFYGILTGSATLREIAKGFAIFGHKLAHCGIKSIPARSSISDANRDRNADMFGDFYMRLYRYYQSELSDSYLKLKINGEIDPSQVQIFDSTTVSLFVDVFKNVGRTPENGQKKGGIKAFTKITLGERVPNFICLKSATTNEKLFLSQLDLSPGTIAIFDKGFHKFSQYKQWNEAKVHYVTRMNDNAKFKIIKERPLEDIDEVGVIKDAEIELSYNCPTTQIRQTVIARMVAYIDTETGNQLVFLTNLMTVKALTVCMLYRNRWTIEPLFKQIKQSFELTYFLADSANGIKTQIWIAMILNLIFTVIHRAIKQAEDFATMVKIAAKHTSSYVYFVNFVRNPIVITKAILENIRKIQLDLFQNPRGGGKLETG